MLRRPEIPRRDRLGHVCIHLSHQAVEVLKILVSLEALKVLGKVAGDVSVP